MVQVVRQRTTAGGFEQVGAVVEGIDRGTFVGRDVAALVVRGDKVIHLVDGVFAGGGKRSTRADHGLRRQRLLTTRLLQARRRGRRRNRGGHRLPVGRGHFGVDG